MKTSNSKSLLRIATIVLAASTALPLMAQSADQSSASNAQVQTGTSTAASTSGTTTMTGTGQPPLETQSHEGFWGHMNPMARKKWVNRQLNPVKDRLNELDQVS
ncbi:MAG: flagellar motor protein MotB, partial [Acidobacteriaceae bacterium]